MELQQFITENMEAILLEWDQFASTLPSATDMGRKELRDHAGTLLQTLSLSIASPTVSSPYVSEPGADTAPGQLHVQARLQDGFSLNEIMAEYAALRTSVARLWRRQMGGADEFALAQLTRFNESIDHALMHATRVYSQQAERSQDLVREQREVDRHKDEFLAILAHELRNPLSPIKTGIELLDMSRASPEMTSRTLEMMGRQLDCLVRLVDDLLDISRINRGKIDLRMGMVDLRDAAGAALEAHNTALTSAQRQLHTFFPQEPLIVRGDFIRLVQIVGNLLSNAAKYTGDDSQIWVRLQRCDNQVRLSVRDDGNGIAPERLGELFQMYMQVGGDSGRGLGIGLALVRSLVEMHGGRVEAHSEGLHCGSEFVVWLPLAGASTAA